MEEKNIMNMDASPLKTSQKIDLNQTTMDFITLNPVLTGFTKTIKSFQSYSENLNSEDGDTETIISTVLNNNPIVSNHIQMIKKK